MMSKTLLLALVFCLFGSASLASGQSALRLEESVVTTPAGIHLDWIKKYLATAKNRPESLEDAARQIAETPSGLFHEDILMAAKKAGQVACTPKLASFSGRVRALIFSEQFGEELYQGQIKKLVNQHTGGLDAETLFAEFYEKYLNEYALAWSMRNSESDLRQQCKAYDVDDVTSCLKALLVFGSAQTTTCKIGLSDEMLFVRTQPIPGGMRMWGW